MRKGIFSVALLVILSTLAMAQSIGPDWDYLRSGTSLNAGKLIDSLMCYANARYDTSKIFYFNGLLPKGLIYLKMVEKAAARDSLYLPRLEYSLIPEPLTGGTAYTGKYDYKLNDSIILRAWGPGDSAAIVNGRVAKWDTTYGAAALQKGRWTLFVDSTAIPIIVAGDTVLRAIPYDFTKYGGIYAIRWRGAIASHATLCSTLVKQFFMTGTKPLNGLRSSN